MLKNPLTLSLLTALCFGGWPLISRVAAGASPLMVAAVVSTVTALVPLLVYVRQGTSAAPASAWMILVIAGIVNGFGMLMYGELVTNKQWNLSTWVPLVVVLMIVVTTLGGVALYGEPLSLRKVVGVLLAAAAVWLMR